ncbi:MAG TPA: cysteine--tRNA ligase [Patescibacteria group bacterium]|nr:cysteine--tRNA ligase [Patescibacteria group bacterium]
METVKLYNTLTRKKEVLKTIRENEVGIYSCGPTVYWNQHIGNMYAFIQWDLLVRSLKFLGMKVKWVMNITDVGHMSGDNEGNADTGEDRMEKGAKREGLTVWEVADKYIKQFTNSLHLLNVKDPDILCRATEHINEQIDLIKKIEANGYTYKTNKGLVFDTAKFTDYAKFANLDLTKQKKREDVEDDPEKKNPWDFFLWVTGNKNHIMQWDSPWGKGYPGWHIECTAMSTKYLGDNFDIHTGGIEHIGIHHTNEIAQGFGAFGKSTANYWLHNAWLLGKKGEKLSKSLGNIVTVQELIEKGYDPIAFRYLVLNSHYRKGLNFSFEALDAANEALINLRNIKVGLKNSNIRTNLSDEKLSKAEEFQTEFRKALCEDLNIPNALAVLWKTLKSNIPSEDKYDLVTTFDEVFGLGLESYTPEKVELTDVVKKLVEEREVYRKNKDFEKADNIRLELDKKGYIVEDLPGGQKVRKK